MSATPSSQAPERFLEHVRTPFHRGRLSDATLVQRMKHPYCGDSVTLQLAVEATSRVVEAWHDGTGCMTSLAAASILCEEIDGKSLAELRSNWLNPSEWTRTEVLEFPGSTDGPWKRYLAPAAHLSPPPLI